MTSAAFQRALDELSAEYRKGLASRLAEIETLWRSLLGESPPPGTIVTLNRELHSIAGSAKTFGLPEVTEAARAAELMLEPFCARGEIPGSEDREHFRRLLNALARTASEK